MHESDAPGSTSGNMQFRALGHKALLARSSTTTLNFTDCISDRFLHGLSECKDFRSTADVMELMDKDIAAAYSERTGKDEAELLAMMDAETWMDADEALAQGFVDYVKKVERKKKPRAEAELPKVHAFSPLAVAAKAKATARRMKMNLK